MDQDSSRDDVERDGANVGGADRSDAPHEATTAEGVGRDGANAATVKPPNATAGAAAPNQAGTVFVEDVAADRGSDEPTLIVDVEGFEGPLDLLLTLARQQKVDLAKISILALADQYLSFIEHARRMRLELAADYLVMAAWLAYLKSRMLLPEPTAPEGMSAADMAKALALRLKRLDAIREAATRLFERPLLGRDVFGRGDPEPIAEIKRPEWSATLYDLLSAYATERQRHALRRVRFAKRNVWTLAEARSCLQRMVGSADDWSRLDDFLIAFVVEPAMRATVFASSLAAALELVREGQMEVHQAAAFAPIYLRKRAAADGEPAGAGAST